VLIIGYGSYNSEEMVDKILW